MRRTGKRAFDPTMGSEGMSQLLITYSIFMAGVLAERRVFSHDPKKNGHPKVPVRKSLAGLALHLTLLVVVGLLAVVGEVETFFLRLVACADPDGDLEDEQDDEGHRARPDQRSDDVPQLRDDLRPGVEVTDLVGDVVVYAGAAELRVDEDARSKGADHAADAVHAEGVERVVVAQHALHRGHGEEAHDSGDGAGEEGADGADETGR